MPGRVTGRTDCLRSLNTGLADLGFSPAQSQMCLLEMGMSETLTPEEPCFSLLSLTRDSSRIHEPLGFCTSQYVICKAAQMWDITEDLCSILCPTWHGTLLEQIFLRACALICKRGKCCSVCGMKGTGCFLEFFALQRNASAKVFRFPLALEMAFPVLTSPWSLCRAPAAAQLFMLLYFKGGLSNGVFSPVPKSNAKR